MQRRDRDIPSKHKSFIKSLSKSITVSLSKIAKDGLFIETLEEVVDALSGDCSGGSPQIGIHLRRKPRSVLHWLQRLQGRGELRSGRLWLMIRFNYFLRFVFRPAWQWQIFCWQKCTCAAAGPINLENFL